MLIVSHEMAFVREIASKVVMMDKGKVIEVGTPAEIFDRPRIRPGPRVRGQDPAALSLTGHYVSALRLQGGIPGDIDGRSCGPSTSSAVVQRRDRAGGEAGPREEVEDRTPCASAPPRSPAANPPYRSRWPPRSAPDAHRRPSGTTSFAVLRFSIMELTGRPSGEPVARIEPRGPAAANQQACRSPSASATGGARQHRPDA